MISVSAMQPGRQDSRLKPSEVTLDAEACVCVPGVETLETTIWLHKIPHGAKTSAPDRAPI